MQRDWTRGAGRRATPADMLLASAEVIVAAAMAQGRDECWLAKSGFRNISEIVCCSNYTTVAPSGQRCRICGTSSVSLGPHVIQASDQMHNLSNYAMIRLSAAALPPAGTGKNTVVPSATPQEPSAGAARAVRRSWPRSGTPRRRRARMRRSRAPPGRPPPPAAGGRRPAGSAPAAAAPHGDLRQTLVRNGPADPPSWRPASHAYQRLQKAFPVRYGI